MLTDMILMEKPERRRGRPARKRYSYMLSVRLTEKQEEWLTILADRYECDLVDIVRRAVSEFAKREGLDGEESK